MTRILLFSVLLILFKSHAFVVTTHQHTICTSLSAAKLPQGISPFEKNKKASKQQRNIQGEFRKIAANAMEQAIRDGKTQLEIEFPPLIGDKTALFDDFDNLQELDANRDWCVQLAPLMMIMTKNRRYTDKWLIFPDDKECELAKKEWGQLFRRSAKFTSIRAAVTQVAGTSKMPWGSNLASALNKLTGGDGILADSAMLDDLSLSGDSGLYIVCQPGNGGPVEDWINVETLHRQSLSAVTCIVNGALDKVRDGYYPAVFFPALAKTVPFYRDFEPVFFLKPISDKGLYGWCVLSSVACVCVFVCVFVYLFVSLL